MYKEITDQDIQSLRSLLSPDQVSNDPVDQMTYSYDASQRQSAPQAVVWIKSTEDVSKVLKYANEHKIPVYARGGGTGLTGGAIPVHGGIALCTSKMNQIINIDAENHFVEVEAGIVLLDMKNRLEEQGLFYPPDPSSAKTAQLGGTLAECAGGLNCVKYGITKDWVLGLEAVMANGDIINIGAKVRKCVVGYNLTQLLVGSEGTLGVITKATLRLIPLPKHQATFLALFNSAIDAAQTSVDILQSGITPKALEFIDRYCLEAVNSYMHGADMPLADAVLLIETDGFDQDIVQRDIEVLQEICKKNNATEIKVANDNDERTHLWKVRKALSPAMHAKAPYKTNEDICVPITKLPEILEKTYAIGEKANIPTLCFGHAGDGNIHVNFMTHTQFDPVVEQAVHDMFIATIECGGTISGEHGIGLSKAPFIKLELGENVRKVHKQIKSLFDPNNILNPGKFIEYC